MEHKIIVQKCITMIIKEYNVDLVALIELRWPGSRHFKSDNTTIFYSESNNGRQEYRIGFIIKESLIKLVKNFEAIDDRCYIIITENPSNITIINCYVLTETADNEYINFFYDDDDFLIWYI